MSNLTPNLTNWIVSLETTREIWWHAALMDVIDTKYKKSFDILWGHAKKALVATEEYNHASFLNPLKEAIYMDESIDVTINSLTQDVFVTIDLYSTAGYLTDYVSAVESARAELSKSSGKDMVKASRIWKKIYEARGGDSDYWKTMNLRLSLMASKAPFWYLINYGNANVPGLDRGGTPYPSVAPQQFVELAQQEIQAKLSLAFEKSKEDIANRMWAEDFGEGGALGEIMEVIAEVDSGVFWQPSEVIREITIESKRYQIWSTTRGLIGLRQR